MSDEYLASCVVDVPTRKRAQARFAETPVNPPWLENSRFIRQMRHSSAPRAGFSKFPIGQLNRG